jgi:hypothetical protein|nr:hypothetical protein [Escherichia coli]
MNKPYDTALEIVNAFEKDNAQQIIVAAAGEIQSLVQKDCIDRSH